MNKKLLLLLALLLLVGLAVSVSLQLDVITLVRARLQTLDFGVAGFLFVVFFAVGSVLLLPNAVLMVLGGAYFGLFWGFLFNLAGFSLGAMAAFLVGRYLAHDYVKAHFPPRLNELMQHIHASGWKLVAVLRISGLVPSIILNYALGITPVKFRDYAWASVVFTAPVCFIITYAGVAGQDFINNGNLKTALAALTCIALGAVLVYVLRKRYVK